MLRRANSICSTCFVEETGKVGRAHSCREHPGLDPGRSNKYADQCHSYAQQALIGEGVLVVTVNNKPIAAMINLGDENPQDILLVASRLCAQMAARSIRNQARKDGTDRTTLKEVNALIKRTRVEQKRDKQVHQA